MKNNFDLRRFLKENRETENSNTYFVFEINVHGLEFGKGYGKVLNSDEDFVTKYSDPEQIIYIKANLPIAAKLYNSKDRGNEIYPLLLNMIEDNGLDVEPQLIDSLKELHKI